MMIQEQMGVIKRSCFVVLVFMIGVSMVVSFQNGKSREEAFLGQLVDPATGEVHEDMAEILWMSCRLDFIHLKEAVEDLDFGFPEETSTSTNDLNSKSRSLAKENIQKLINVLHPQLKKTLLDCIRKNNLLFHVSGEDVGSKIWYTKYSKSLYPRPDTFRRNLGSISATPAPAPAPTFGSPNFSPAPSPNLAQSTSQAPESQPTAPSPQQPFFPPNFGGTSSQPPANENSSASSDSASNGQGNDKSNNHKTIIIAVVVTAAVTFVVAALLFLCCSRIYRKGSGVRQNDERPLLSLSLSDYSVGSSHKTFALGDSIKEPAHVNQFYSNNSSHHKNPSIDKPPSLGNVTEPSAESFDTSSNINAQVPPSFLKPPPGRLGTAPTGLPPLKPPPGRADPLPHEPPTSYKPPRPPPPLPPVPPPSLLPTAGSAGPPPPGPPPPPPPKPPGPHPPPPPKIGPAAPRPPPPMGIASKLPRPPLGPKNPSNTASSEGAGSVGDADAPKAKLKPFFWDKVLANPDHSMVWHQIKSGSFQFNEEMIETLFGAAPVDKNKNERKKESSSQDSTPQYIQIIDPKKSQNLAILLRALNVTIEEVCDALNDGNELPAELIQTLLKMAPTQDEELKLRLFSGELSQLGPAERFLKALVGIPFAFKRLEALLFMCTLQEEVTATKESFETLEVACKELRNSRLFLKLLEAVLKTGNRMNDGTFRGGAQAFKLDTLLKLSDVKGVDGKTTLLHFVVQEIIRSEGIRAARVARESRSFSSIKSDDLLEETNHETEEHYRSLGLQVVSGVGNQLENVKKAAVLDADSLTGTVARLGHVLLKTRDFLNSDMNKIEEESEFHQTLKSFVQNAEVDVMSLLEEEKRIMALVKSTGDYFHGNAGKDEGLRLFVVVRDFLIMLDKVCKEVREAPKKPAKTQKKEGPSAPSPSDSRQSPADLRQRLFPQITDRRMDNLSSSSDDES